MCSGQVVCETAVTEDRPAGAPRLADVSMRLFKKHPDKSELSAAESFHINRADWCYISDVDYIRDIHELGWTYQGSMNAVTTNAEHAKRDKDGKPMLDHFGKAGRYWADNDNEEYRKWYLRQLHKWAEAGADGIQRDEPTTCLHTPVSEAARFFKIIHSMFEKELGRHMPMSCNLGWNGCVFGGEGEPVTMLFDFGMAEMRRNKISPDFFWKAARDARERDKALVYTSPEDLGVDNYRLAIAACYANGMHFMVPWDQFGGVNKPRVFSRPEDLADLYGFVRANAPHLEGYADAAALGHGLEDARWKKETPLTVQGTDSVSAFIRAKPGERDAPVTIHLIEWGKPGAFELQIRPESFFDQGEMEFSLKTPPPFDAELHNKAETSKNYSPLSASIALNAQMKKGMLVLDVPALTPWGLLIVSKKRP